VAERGIVVVGAGSIGVERADRLAATLGWPLVVEPTAGGRPMQAISTAHLLSSHAGFADSHRPDVALVIGRAGLSRPLATFLADVPTLVADSGRWTDPGRRAVTFLAGEPVVDPAIVEPRNGSWRRSWLAAERVARRALDEVLDSFEAPTELRIARDTAAVGGDVLVVSSSMPIRDLDITMAPGRSSVFANRGASGIDGFVSTVLGVAAVRGSATALAGDLSMLHDQNGFLIDPRPDAVFVVVDNDGGGIFSFLPQATLPSHLFHLFATPHGRSFERYAAFHGLGHQAVTDPARLAPAIVEASSAGGVQLIVVKTDRRRSVEQHRQVTAAVHRAVSEHLRGD
jgi:2-succinyl-5-enolpyruvyl-6-hydroxy-3-cyclohexene-1-carboxylate synthase